MFYTILGTQCLFLVTTFIALIMSFADSRRYEDDMFMTYTKHLQLYAREITWDLVVWTSLLIVFICGYFLWDETTSLFFEISNIIICAGSLAICVVLVNKLVRLK